MATSFQLHEAVAVLERTPAVLRAWLAELPESWLAADEGPDTFSPVEVLGHLVHGERSDWMARTRTILEHGAARSFEPFDRFAHRRDFAGWPVGQLLDEFDRLRASNLDALRALRITEAQLDLEGLHPALGAVTLGALLATWVAHDLGHLAQIARVMAKRYRDDVGPWLAYLPIMTR
jgi:DinB superfamily